jgi:hypothetical protein
VTGLADPLKPRLNPAQRRALGVALRLLEERLATVDEVIERSREGILYRRPLLRTSPEARRVLNEQLGGVRDTILSLAETYELEREPRDPLREIVGLLSISWESLGDVGSRGLSAYGPVDHRLRSTLDPVLEELMARLLELERLVRQSASMTMGQDLSRP